MSTTLTADSPFHTHELEVRFRDCDMYGHVNHAVYLEYLESARVKFLESRDLPIAALQKSGTLLVVRRIDIRYRAPAFLGQRLTVRSRISGVKNAGGTFEQEVLHGERTLVLANVEWVCVDTAGKPRRMPAELASLYR